MSATSTRAWSTTFIAAIVITTGVFGGVPAAGCLAALLAAVGCWRSGYARRRSAAALGAARRRRRHRRELRLDEADVPTRDLDALESLLAEARRLAPRYADEGEPDDLLDLYVSIAIAKRRYEERLANAPAGQLDALAELTRSVRASAASWHGRASERSSEHRELLEDVSAMLRLYAGRATMPEIEHLLDDDIVDRQLAELEP